MDKRLRCWNGSTWPRRWRGVCSVMVLTGLLVLAACDARAQDAAAETEGDAARSATPAPTNGPPADGAAADEGPGAAADASGGPEGSGGAAGGPPPALVRLAEVEMREVRERRLVTGELQAEQRTLVAAEESGRVVQAPPDAGTPVEADAVLAKIDAALTEAQLAAAEAQVVQARAEIERAQAVRDEAVKRRQRYADLRTTDAVTEEAYDQAVRDAAVAEAQLADARALLQARQAAVRELKIRLEKKSVNAPFDGYITVQHAEEGQWLSPGSPVAEMVRIARIDATLDVPERMLPRLDRDATIEVLVPALGERFDGRIYRIVPSGDVRARTFPVLIRLDNPEGRLKPGMSAEAMLPTGRITAALTVPRDAVQVTAGGARVLVNRGGRAAEVAVSVRFGLDDRFVIEPIDPLRAGDQVVIEGNERLSPGQPLQVMGAGDRPGGPPADAESPRPE